MRLSPNLQISFKVNTLLQNADRFYAIYSKYSNSEVDTIGQ